MGPRRFHLRMLLQRGGVWTYHRVVPKELQAVLGGKRQIWRSLKTTDFETAKLRAMEIGLQVERQFLEARDRLRRAPNSDPESLARDWQRQALSEDLEWRRSIPTRRTPEELEAELEALSFAITDHKGALSAGDTSLVIRLLREVLQQYGFHIPPKDQHRFASALLKVRLQALEIAHQRAEDGVENPMVSDVLERWIKNRKPPSKTEAEWRSVFRRWEAVNGLLAVRSVQKSHVRAFRDSLTAVPSKRSADGKVSPVTVRKALAVLSSVFRWAVREGYLEHAPTEGITGIRGSRTRDWERTRLPYSLENLNTILKALPTEQDSPSKHWLPLLAMWTGARVEELCQLHVTDVGQEDGVPFIHIHGGEGRSVKTCSATRRVPVHPELERLGFLEYVKHQKGSRCFMDLIAGPHGKLSHALSKYWGRFADELGITDSRKTFHSLRHGFASACRRAEMPLSIQEALMGHSSGRVSERYGETYPLKVLAEWVRKIDYPGLG